MCQRNNVTIICCTSCVGIPPHTCARACVEEVVCTMCCPSVCFFYVCFFLFTQNYDLTTNSCLNRWGYITVQVQTAPMIRVSDSSIMICKKPDTVSRLFSVQNGDHKLLEYFVVCASYLATRGNPKTGTLWDVKLCWHEPLHLNLCVSGSGMFTTRTESLFMRCTCPHGDGIHPQHHRSTWAAGSC